LHQPPLELTAFLFDAWPVPFPSVRLKFLQGSDELVGAHLIQAPRLHVGDLCGGQIGQRLLEQDLDRSSPAR
jgi:hypothetical protein